MNVLEYIKHNTVYLDGGMGTLLQSEGLLPGELPERWNLSHPDIIERIHKDYFDSGANIINANTFGANLLKLSAEELDRVISSALNIARSAREKSKNSGPMWIALDVGPTGKMLKPYGDLDFEDAVSIFKESVRLGEKHGADLIFIETMNDSYETKAALLAAKEASSLPVFVSNAYGEDGKLMTGADPHAMIAMLEGMGADAIGVNCSLGPAALSGVVREYLQYSSLPIILKPNAGLPKSENGKTVYDISPEEFASEVAMQVGRGVRLVGGCCGTTPEFIKKTVEMSAAIPPVPIEPKSFSVVSSYTHAVTFGDRPVLIGERINPTGKKRFKEALAAKDMAYILREGIAEEEAGAHILDVNVGLPEINEEEMLTSAVRELQAVLDLPLQIDTSDVAAMEAALRIYNGKAMINSVNGKKESMAAVFPLVKKYGGVVVALTLDEQGIPQSAEGRLRIAERILSVAKEYGIEKKDIIFDPLALTVSADSSAAKETLRAVDLITSRLGAKTSLGVSNVSFGLPARDILNGSFFTLALAKGLSAAIMNPHSEEMIKAYRAYLAITGLDDNFVKYIEFADTVQQKSIIAAPKSTSEKAEEKSASGLKGAIIKGLRELAARETESLLLSTASLDIVQGEIIPALNEVGEGFEKKTVYLPGLLMSAEAAKSAFEVIKSSMRGSSDRNRATVVIATVRGDIHDIGKNIVKLLLENYGFNVIDLGKDVPPERIVREAVQQKAAIVGLSALMTTTVPAMEETVKLLRMEAPWCKIIVGGAVLTQEYADMIGADAYAKDAMGAVRYAEEIEKSPEK